jgi:hypothetical protein
VTEVEAFPQFKLFEWKRISHADCLMTRAELWILSTGQSHFSADVQTSDADDVWLVRSLALKDNNGLELYRIPQFNGPNMVEDDRVYFFIKRRCFTPHTSFRMSKELPCITIAKS